MLRNTWTPTSSKSLVLLEMTPLMLKQLIQNNNQFIMSNLSYSTIHALRTSRPESRSPVVFLRLLAHDVRRAAGQDVRYEDLRVDLAPVGPPRTEAHVQRCA